VVKKFAKNDGKDLADEISLYDIKDEKEM